MRRRVAEMLDLVGLPGIEQKYPAQLSGGQQQRVALRVRWRRRPTCCCSTRPLSALDAIERVRAAFRDPPSADPVGRDHDHGDARSGRALAMADRIVVMKSGRIQQVGGPRDIYRAPANHFVADFIPGAAT